MIFWKEYEGHKPKILGKSNKKYDNTIYTFDIETTSFLILNGKQIRANEYSNLSEKEKDEAIAMSTMYIWMFSINENVYYGRTFIEFRAFLERLEYYVSDVKKYVYVHNLAYEFTFMQNEFDFDYVFARKSRKPLMCKLKDYNIVFKCSYFLSNLSLDNLAKVYKLPVKKLIGNLDYNLIRHYNTELTEKEKMYCKNDCLVVYEYIKFLLKKYETLINIPLTSTGFVRRELKEKVKSNFNYRNKIRKTINTEGTIYNVLVQRICWSAILMQIGYIQAM